MRVLKIIAVLIVLIIASGYGLFKYSNRTAPQLKEPNYFTVYKNQDTTPEGKLGIFISHLIMPEEMRIVDFNNLALKIKQYIP